MVSTVVHQGDCLQQLEALDLETIDLSYLDPPFFSQKVQSLKTRDGSKAFSFDDIWDSNREYTHFIFERLMKMHAVLKDTGSIFFHCDKSASHLIRFLLDAVFGAENFRSEIIWHYRRWSNAKKGLLPAHQVIFFYSKTENFKFNTILTDYSPTTNLDQILQKRVRDERNKAVYARDEDGEIISNGAKKGVPLSDVWEIPYLNPKARERVGYPTQKPILLLERIIEIATDKGDTVLDPFCGSGTTLVAAKLLGRSAIGIDSSHEAVNLTRERLNNPVKSRSDLLDKGKSAYMQHDEEVAALLSKLDYTPVQRNSGIDGILKQDVGGVPVLLRVQREGESLLDAASALKKASQNKGACVLVVIQTQPDIRLSDDYWVEDVVVVPAMEFMLNAKLQSLDSVPLTAS